jgi:hypothetical protein
VTIVLYLATLRRPRYAPQFGLVLRDRQPPPGGCGESAPDVFAVWHPDTQVCVLWAAWVCRIWGLLRMGNGAKWRIGLTTMVFVLGLPSIFVVLATAGESSNGVFAGFIGRPGIYLDFWGVLELVCFFGIPMLVVAIPARLHWKGRPWRASSHMPGWLAGFAAALTVAYILALHFDNLGLAKWRLGALSVAAFGAAVLLAPFYRIVANACWEAGIAVVFDPLRWWSECCVACREMK